MVSSKGSGSVLKRGENVRQSRYEDKHIHSPCNQKESDVFKEFNIFKSQSE